MSLNIEEKRLVRFDWAMKYLLRNKANYDIVEGFLCALLEDNDLKVLEILESDSNKDDESDKFNRVDVVVKDSQGRKILIEIQNSREADYLYRILYSTSKAIAESINSGDKYLQISKIISVNILYFDLGIGEDYLYYGQTEFVGVNTQERINKDNEKIKKLIPQGAKYNILEIYPEYYLIQVEKYPNVVKRAIDEWIYWFKNEKIKEGSHSKHIEKVAEKLDILKMSKEARKSYEKYLENLAADLNILETAHYDGYKEAEEKYKKKLEQAKKKAEQERKEKEQAKKREEEVREKLVETAKLLKNLGVDIDVIIQKTGLTQEEIEKLF